MPLCTYNVLQKYDNMLLIICCKALFIRIILYYNDQTIGGVH